MNGAPGKEFYRAANMQAMNTDSDVTSATIVLIVAIVALHITYLKIRENLGFNQYCT